MTMLGFRIEAAPSKPPLNLVEAFRGVVTAHLSDNMSRLCGVVGLKRYHREGQLLGTAFTVKTRPGDNLMIHKAVDLAGRGDVLVVDGGGDLNNALVGELLKMYAETRGIAGFVIDGAIRDVAAFVNSDFPCYARGETHKGPYKEGPGEINVPVTIGGLVVNPGDIIVGDEDGVVAVPVAGAADLLGRARQQADREEQAKRAIGERRYDRSWVDAMLSAKGLALPESAVR